MKTEDLHTEFKTSFGDEVMPLLVFFTNKQKVRRVLVGEEHQQGRGKQQKDNTSIESDKTN